MDQPTSSMFLLFFLNLFPKYFKHLIPWLLWTACHWFLFFNNFLLLQSTYYMSKKSRSFSFPILNGSCLVGHTILVQVDEFGGGLNLMDPPISSVVLLSFLNLFQIYFQHLIHWLLFYGQFVMIFSFLIFFFSFFYLLVQVHKFGGGLYLIDGPGVTLHRNHTLTLH